jgi:tRNA threonylcarbamoyladenosine biosynthesis protein TsaB
MKLLAFDASTTVATCAVSENEVVLASFTTNHPKTHSELLLPMIDHVLSAVDWKISDLDALVVADGPGSFTGLRIALATAKALAHAYQTPIYTVSTLLGFAYHGKMIEACVCPILDARRGQVYTALYENEGHVTHIEPTTEIIDDLIVRLEPFQRVLFVGDGVPVHREKIKSSMGERAWFGENNLQYNTAIGLLQAHRNGWSTERDYLDLSAQYLRKAQAERERENRG